MTESRFADGARTLRLGQYRQPINPAITELQAGNDRLVARNTALEAVVAELYSAPGVLHDAERIEGTAKELVDSGGEVWIACGRMIRRALALALDDVQAAREG